MAAPGKPLWRSALGYPLLVCLGLLASCGGCGRGVYPVEGQLAWPDGSPATELVGSLVEFEKSDPPPISARGEVREDGTFSLVTPGRGNGAVPGNYRVLIVAALPSDRDAVPPPPIDPKYQTFDNSGLTFQVAAGQNAPLFKLNRNPHLRRGR